MKKKIIVLSIISVILIISIMLLHSIYKKEGFDTLVGKENLKMDNNVTYGSYVLGKEKKYESLSVDYDEKDFKDLPVFYASASYAYDTSSPEKAIGVADYAFIAKVNGILKTEYRHPAQVVKNGEEVTVYDPYTVYSVDVIENIKGELTKKSSIELVLHGGLMEDKQSYSFMEGLDFLSVGDYYIFLPYTASDGRMGISCQTSVIPLGELSESEVATLKNFETLKLSAYGLSTSNGREENSGRETIDIISTYIEASKKPVIPAGKETRKSEIYDVKMIEEN